MVADHEHGRAPRDFAYYVFESRSEEPAEEEISAGIYLMGTAEARHLQQFFDPLYAMAGIGICTSDDEIVSGIARLTALGDAVEAAIKDVERRTSEWPVEIGVTLESLSSSRREAIIRHASQSRLLEFLRGVAERVERARLTGGYVHFGGGG